MNYLKESFKHHPNSRQLWMMMVPRFLCSRGGGGTVVPYYKSNLSTSSSFTNRKLKIQRVNEKITVQEVTVIDEHGKKLGEKMDLRSALTLSRERRLDLVEVSSISTLHSICKLISPQDRYQKGKKEEKVIKDSRRDMEKEFQVGSNIAEHDLMRQVDYMKSYLEKGYTIKLLVKLRRTNSRIEIATEKQNGIIRQIDASLKDIGKHQDETKSVRGGKALEFMWRPRDKPTMKEQPVHHSFPKVSS